MENLFLIKREIEDIQKEEETLNIKKIDAFKRAQKIFNEMALKRFGQGWEIVKIKRKNGTYTYGIITTAKSFVWNDGKKIKEAYVSVYGLFLIQRNDWWDVTNDLLLNHEHIFTFSSDIETCTLDELNTVINKWYEEEKNFNLNSEGDPEFVPDPKWFKNNNFYYKFLNYTEFLKNENITNEYKKLN